MGDSGGCRVRAALGALLLAGWVPCAAMAADLPDLAAVRAAWRPSDVRVLADDGRLIQRVRTDFLARRGDWVPLARISAALQRAVVQSEDHRFPDHGGVDWVASAAAAWLALSGHPHRGASTLSMQLAAMLDPDLRRGPEGRGVWQKLEQMRAARSLEVRWTKPGILEAYLNLASFRGELVGVDALARVMFRKRASGLTLRESALAAVLLRGPNASERMLTQRSCALLRDLGRPEDCAGLRDFVRLALSRAQGPAYDEPDLAPHWARWLLAAGPAPQDGILRTTLQAGLQSVALRAVRRHLSDLRGTGVTDAAVVVLDNRTGAVLAYVGSSGPLSAAPDVDHARAPRQAGSTLKPFLYAQALDEQRLTAASLLDDRPVDLEGGSGLYVPDNYDHRYSGWVSARTALAASLNIPAVRTLMLVGPDALARRLEALGLPVDRQGDYYGYSLALGSADVTLLSLTNAYRALARGGMAAPVAPWSGGAGQRGIHLYSAQAAWLVGDILADREARARTFGLDSPLATRFWSAVKTGTSRDMRDNWCIGWTAAYTVGVWVGNSAGAAMREVSGVSGAGPIWQDVMDWLHRQEPVPAPSAPAGITARRIRFAPGLEPARLEYFLGDTAQPDFAPPPAPAADRGQPRIAEPVDGTIIALDPDIPLQRQRLRLSAVDALSRPVRPDGWFLDGVPHAQADEPGWIPRPGRHVFELRDPSGRVLDRARVEVRPIVVR